MKGCGLKKKTLVLVDRTTPLDKSLLIEKLGVCSESQLRRIEDGIALYNGMMPKYSKLCLQDLINAYKTAHIFLSNQIATDKYKQSQENLIKSYCESYDINFDNVFKQMIYEK